MLEVEINKKNNSKEEITYSNRYEINGNEVYVQREFLQDGISPLWHLITFLLEMMEKEEKCNENIYADD